MTDARPDLNEYSPKRSLEDVYDLYAKHSDMKSFFYDWGGLNEWLFTHINGIRGGLYDQLVQMISLLGDHKLFLHYLGAIAIFALLSTLLRKLRRKGSIRPRLSMWTGVFLVLLAGYAANGVAVITAKDYFDYPRPYVLLAEEDVHLMETPDKGDDFRSMPSGHVAFITFLIISLWPVFGERWRWHTLWLIALMAWSRISVGHHFPADTVYAFLLSATVIVAVRAVIYTVLRKLFNIVC